MVDLSGMKAVQVDPEKITVRAEPGLTLGEFDRATQAFGLATTLGVVSVTGIAGLTLGGGLGWLNGRYGLACDNLISADVVTPDGQLLRASTQQNEDLFWGIRGGGGNFGVVTSFEYQLHPVDLVLAGVLSYPLSMAPRVLRVAVVRCDRLGSQHRVDQCAVPSHAATPREVGVRQQPR
jgi:FAD/FMN-containing dehydrogenase